MFQTIMDNSDVILSTLTGIVTIASIIVAGTRTPSSNTIMGKLYKAVEFLSLTVG